MSESNFPIAALLGVFSDTAEFTDPIAPGTVFTVRRAGSKVLQEIARKRAKGDKISVLATHALLSGERGAIATLAEKHGINPVDVLQHYGEMKLHDALAKLVTWQMDTGQPFNSENARNLLSHDWPLPKSICPPEAWALIETRARKEWDQLQEALESEEGKAKPFKGLGEWITVGEAYQYVIRHFSDQHELFRSQALEAGAKN